MPVVSVPMISKEVINLARQLGQVVSETLATLVVSTIVNPKHGGFCVERPIDESDVRMVVEEATRRIISTDTPGINCLRLQAGYEGAYAEMEREAQSQKTAGKSSEEKVVAWISNFTAKFDQDFDTLTTLYKKIFQFLLLRCTGPMGKASPPKDPVVEREVAAALESVFPRVGLRSFVALTGPEKAAQLQELAGIVLGIRLFNQHQNKGGTGLPKIDDLSSTLKGEDVLQQVQQEVDEENELCKMYVDLLTAFRTTSLSRRPPSQQDLDRLQRELLYHRQYFIYLLNIQEDLVRAIDQVYKDEQSLQEELVDLDALVGGRVSVPKEHVYPRFDALARNYRTAWLEISALEARVKLQGVLGDLRRQYFPKLSEDMQELVQRYRALDGQTDAPPGEPADLEQIPGPAGAGESPQQAVRLTVENTPEFLQLPLDFQGFCIHTLVTKDALVVAGNPALGVLRYAGRFCTFATERGCVDFCAEPDRFFAGVREVCYRHPELVHLLRIQEDFPQSSLHFIVQHTAGTKAPTMADVSTETPLHIEESNIDKGYQWNEWKMRQDALHMADIKKKQTSATQTALSHLRRENETQVYLPKEVATNTTVERGTNPPRFRKYTAGLRGEPQPMKVVEVKFDL